MSTPRTITLHVFASVKGGVGKSTLAYAAARLLAAADRHVAILDTDFTGTSLADAIPLRAPRLPEFEGQEGLLDLDAAPEGLLTRDETNERRVRRRRSRRTSTKGALWLPYLNDVMTLETEDEATLPFRMAALLWRSDDADSMAVAPASPLWNDISAAATWVASGATWIWKLRLSEILFRLVAEDSALTDIVLDLPPGMHGYALEALHVAGAISAGVLLDLEGPDGTQYEGPDLHPVDWRWRTNPFLVCTPDRNDFLQAIESYLPLTSRSNPLPVAGLRPLLNRTTEGVDAVWDRAADVLDRQYSGWGLQKEVLVVRENDVLAHVFRGKSSVSLERESAKHLWRALRLTTEDSN